MLIRTKMFEPEPRAKLKGVWGGIIYFLPIIASVLQFVYNG